MKHVTFTHMRPHHRHSALPLVMAASVLLTGLAQAATFTVTSTADSGPHTLRQAILDANANPDADTITFDLGAGAHTINLAGPLDLATDITMQGPGPNLLTIRRDTGGEYGILTVAANSFSTCALSGLTLANGSVYYGGGGIFIASQATVTIDDCIVRNNTVSVLGGGLVNLGTLTVTNSIISGNSAEAGGGIENRGSLTVINSTISGNSAADGGGIDNQAFLTVSSSTINGNHAGVGNGGGGIYNSLGTVIVNNSTIFGNDAGDGGGIDNWEGTVTLDNTTISGNHVTAVNGEFGGGINTYYGSLTIRNSIIALNSSGDIENYNNGTTMDASDHDFIGGDPMLGALADNGGPTQTMALLPGSPCINAGDPSFAGPPDFDQRGAPFARVGGSTIDIGAFEIHPMFLNVDNTGDVSDGDYSHLHLSLREAIELSNATPGSYVIQFDPAVFSTPQTINLTAALPDLATATEINGPGAKLLTVRQDTHRLDNVFSNRFGTVAVSGMTIADSGGGIDNVGGTLSVHDSAFRGNNGFFGGISNHGGTLTVDGSVFSGNSSPNYSGGGISNTLGTLLVTNSTFSGNSADEGGGIFIQQSGATVINCTFNGNSATEVGGAIWSDDGTLVVRNSTIAGNSTGTDGGGGIAYARGSIAVSNSIIAQNIGGDVLGGEDDASVDISNHNFIGGDPMLAPLADNGGPTQTMALLPHSPCINAGDPNFAGPPNTDQRGLPRIGGWVLDIGAYEYDALNESLVVTTTSDEDNGTSDPSFGNGTSLREAIQYADLHAGAETITFNLGASPHTINLTGALPSLVGDMDIQGPGSSLLTVRRDTGGDYGIFYVDVDSANVVTLSGMTISNGSVSNDNGSAVHAGWGATLTLEDCIVHDNSTAWGGAAIAALGGNLTLNRCTVTSNDGGGIYLDYVALTVNDSTISGNDTTGRGGGINAYGGTITINNSTLNDNTATSAGFDGGGAIYFVQTDPNIITSSISNSTLSGNSAPNAYGGAIHCEGDLTVTNCTLEGNNANGAGGAILHVYGTATITNSTLAGNSSAANGGDDLGGGAITNQGLLILNNCTIAGNSTSGNTGAVENIGTLTANNTIIAANTGGDIFNDDIYGATTDTSNHNFIGGNPLLGLLADNGGPTQTMALLPGSPCINAGDPSFTSPPDFDQRGAPFARVFGGRIDMGAYELSSVPADFDGDGDVDADDLNAFKTCATRSDVPFAPGCEGKDLDHDGDVDMNDFGIFQRCYSGKDRTANPNCVP